MTDLDRNHPAVEAGAEGMEYPHLPTAHDAINAALPYLTADDLRNTPAGRALMAEAWEDGVRQFAQFGDVDRNPYRKETPQ